MKHLQPTKFWITKITSEHDIDYDAVDSLREELRPIIEKHGFNLSLTETFSLGLEKLSITSCEKCEQLFVNRDFNPCGLDKDYVPEDIDVIIYDGGTFEGKQLCELCLPHSHRWGHSS
ncbi:hypothetical protein H0A36_26975 [Endozoicomonas sp. SM1973]|uniref:Uncharacterized protein n=1 Tax=Spartinivicinus marinus TaxID=2994442 RepID=A0A853ICT1_9GAMM|nr:hypothetical protein [Spartinivicinus marinus]MCX4030521.1 hypothetical protein [Spartinivicinus marinus]NYZ69662.1 hypothetical protein [Spartinivicinus marinus]